MTLSKLPSGRWRARVWSGGRDVPVAPVLGLPKGTTWATRREAKAAREEARKKLGAVRGGDLTVLAFWEKWTTDPLFSRPKLSTDIHNRERTKAFVERYGSLSLRQVSDVVVSEWLAGGGRNGTIPALRAMFNDALSAKAGRLVDGNPFARLGVSRTRGNRDVQPPGEEMVRALILKARELSGPSFAAWLQVAAYTGMRPGELDALRWDAVDLDASRILVAEQFSATSGTFTLPKNGRRRYAPLTPPAREALLSGRYSDEFVFANLRGDHWTASSRAYHFKAAKAAVGYTGTLYLATRHFAGWWMYNVLGLPAEDVAIALGHEDGGYLIRVLYGHRDREVALDRVIRAYEERANVVPMPRREETG